MGVATTRAAAGNGLERRDAAVIVAAYTAGAVAAAAASAITVALIAFGWRDISWVLTAPGRQGVLAALLATALIVAIALPITFAAGALAAVSASDTSIGDAAGKALRESLEWSSGIPPVVIGAAVFFTTIVLGNKAALAAAAVALALLNLPKASAGLAKAFAAVQPEIKEAAAALGASPVASFVGLVQPSTVWAVAAALFTLASQMIGETSAVTLALGASAGQEPLSVQIWHFASNPSLADTEAAACIVLVVAVAAFALLARACEHKHLETSAAAS